MYKGFTEDLKVRLKNHNGGRVKSTKSGRPWALIYYKAFMSKLDARREVFLITGKGRERIKWLFKK